MTLAELLQSLNRYLQILGDILQVPVFNRRRTSSRLVGTLSRLLKYVINSDRLGNLMHRTRHTKPAGDPEAT